MKYIELNTHYFPFVCRDGSYYGAEIKIQQVVEYKDLSDEWINKYDFIRRQKEELFPEFPIFLVGYFCIVLNPWHPRTNDEYHTLQGWPKYPCVLVSTINNKWIRLDCPTSEIEIKTDFNTEVFVNLNGIDEYKKQYKKQILIANSEPQIIFITKKRDGFSELQKSKNTVNKPTKMNRNTSFILMICALYILVCLLTVFISLFR